MTTAANESCILRGIILQFPCLQNTSLAMQSYLFLNGYIVGYVQVLIFVIDPIANYTYVTLHILKLNIITRKLPSPHFVT
jgi:hypothetical protein